MKIHFTPNQIQVNSLFKIKQFAIGVVAFLMCNTIFAQMPGTWTVNPSNFSNTASITCKINQSCFDLTNPNNAVAAFVGGQCRGVVNTNVFVSSTGDQVATLTVYSNASSGEVITFQAYNDASNNVFNGVDTLIFVADKVFGSIAMPFIVTENHTPTDIGLSNTSISEDAVINDVVGSLTAVDDNNPNVFTFTLPAGILDNDDYLISGTDLLLNKPIDYAVDNKDTVQIAVTDAFGCTYVENFVLNVVDVAYPPVANVDVVSVDEDMSITVAVLANDIDLDNDIDTNSLMITRQPMLGTVTIIADGELVYVPYPNINGNDTIIYSICDLTLPIPQCDTAIVIITVEAVDDAPVADPDAYAIIEDMSEDFYVLDNDLDDDSNMDSTSLTVITGPSNGVATINADWSINYVPNQFYNGNDTLIYQICDLTAPTPLCDTAIVIITIIAVPNAPIAFNDTLTVDEDLIGIIQVLTNDFDADNDIDSSSVTIYIAPQNGTASADTLGNVTYQSDLNYFGLDSLYYIVCDQTLTGALCDTAMIYINVLPVPDAPDAVNDTTNTPEDIPINIDVLLNDTDPENNIDASSITIISSPLNGTASVVGGQINYVPNNFYYGLDSLVYQVCDMTSPTPLCDTAIVYIIIDLVPNAPIDLMIDTLFINEDNAFQQRISTIKVTDNDYPDSFFYELVSGAGDEDNNQFSIVDSTLYMETKTNFDIKQQYNFRVLVTDSYGLTYEEAFVLDVLDIEGNDIPLPSANFISPNGDGKNDFWVVENVEIYVDFKLIIVDQFGQILYQADQGYDNTWDGTFNGAPLTSGNYYYIFLSETKTYKGNITIVNNN